MKIIPFLPNRVLRLYNGGSGIDRLCGRTPAADSRFPENWIASCIEGNGRAYHSPGHGISRIMMDGKEVLFPEYLKTHAAEMLGERHAAKYGPVPAVLVKFLDSAEQLPLQVHPTRADARKFLHSENGKTEAWIVLATREINGEKPYLLTGFSPKLDAGVFAREVLNGKFERGGAMLNKLEVKPGDVIVIPGGLPHAIGPGVTMVEIMEPSDWVIIPETACCGIELSLKQRFMGIAPEDCLKMFDFTPRSCAAVREYCGVKPQVLEQRPGGTYRRLIPQDAAHGLFSACELELNGSWDYENPEGFAIGAVTAGRLAFDGVELAGGGSFFLPYALKKVHVSGHGKVIFVFPPEL